MSTSSYALGFAVLCGTGKHEPLRIGNHQVIPARRRYEALGEVVEPGARAHAGRLPELLRQPVAARRRRQHLGGDAADGGRAQVELADQHVGLPVEEGRRITQ